MYIVQLFSLSFDVFIFRPKISYLLGHDSVSWSVSELQSLSLESSYVPRPGNIPMHLSPQFLDTCLDVSFTDSQDVCNSSFFAAVSVSLSDVDNFLLIPLGVSSAKIHTHISH